MTNTMSCGCEIISDNLGAYKIEYCPKHEAAEGVYEVLKEFMERFNSGTRFPLQSTCDKANQVLANVEGK